MTRHSSRGMLRTLAASSLSLAALALQCAAQAAGPFAAPTIWTGPRSPKSGVIGDFNGDGNADFLFTATAFNAALDGELICHLGNGAGTFGAAVVTVVPNSAGFP